MIYKIEIPNYLRRIKVSNARRKKYYTSEKQIKSKKYQDRDKYNFVKGVLVDLTTGEAIVANPKAAGTPQYKIISSQALYAQMLHPVTRAKMMHELKTEFCKYLKDLEPIKDIPIRVTMEFHDLPHVNQKVWDLENRVGIYLKGFNDALTGYKIKGVNSITPLIEDDNVNFITSYTQKFIAIKEDETPKLVIILEKEPDERCTKHITV